MNPANLPPADQPWAITAFQQEAEVLARLNHPTIARVVDFFQENQYWYLVMEYVHGEALDAALGDLSAARARADQALVRVRSRSTDWIAAHHSLYRQLSRS